MLFRSLGDFKVNLIDTAGIHDTDDKVEKIGVDKAKSYISSADLILFLVDSSRDYSDEDEKIFNEIRDKKYIVIKTKSDLETSVNKKFHNEINLSTVTKDGVEELKNKIISMMKLENFSSSSVIITNERHKNALERALESIKNAIETIDENTLDLVAVDIKDAYFEIGEITGNTTSEDIIDQIFDKFCLGK